MLAQGTKIFVAPGEHSFSIFRVENVPWSLRVLLKTPLLNITSRIIQDFNSDLSVYRPIRVQNVLKICRRGEYILLVHENAALSLRPRAAF